MGKCLDKLPELLVELTRRLDKSSTERHISKAFVKVKFNDFTSTTVERVGTSARISDYRSLLEEALQRKSLPVRLLGVGVRFTESDDAFVQLDLFSNANSGSSRDVSKPLSAEA